jgi:dTDP-4-amino-4,6-dideoxygalactose transaminase
LLTYVDLVAQHRPLKKEILAAVGRVLDHGMFILGPEVEELERRVAEFLGVGHVVGVGSGTDALILALRLRGVGPGDEVLTVSHSFVATANAIALVGARPVFVDIDEPTMLLDPGALAAALTPRTRAVLPVHLNGFPCEMEKIASFCDQHGLHLIEDCAQAFGTRVRGRAVGSFGLGAFSLHPLKTFSACGDGGFITAADEEDAVALRRLRNLGLEDRDHCAAVNGNSRLDALQAAILLVKLPYVGDWMAARRRHAEAYRVALGGRVGLPPEEGDNEVNYSCFAIRHPKRDELQTALRDRGIDAKAHYPVAIHRQKAFADREHAPLPVTEKVVSQILSLPVTPELSEEGREWVIAACLDCLNELAEK